MSVWDDLEEPAQAAPMMLRGQVSSGHDAPAPYSASAVAADKGHTWIDYEAPKPNRKQQAIKDARINNMVFGQGYDPRYAEGRLPAQQNEDYATRRRRETLEDVINLNGQQHAAGTNTARGDKWSRELVPYLQFGQRQPVKDVMPLWDYEKPTMPYEDWVALRRQSFPAYTKAHPRAGISEDQYIGRNYYNWGNTYGDK